MNITQNPGQSKNKQLFLPFKSARPLREVERVVQSAGVLNE
jgi:hypothetical protein